MTLNLNLKEKYPVGDSHPVGKDPSVWDRTWAGFDQHASDEANFEQNRGVYHLGARSHREEFVTMSLVHTVRIVAKIEKIVDVELHGGGVKQAVVAHVLAPGDPDYDRLIGREIDPRRNPVRYLNDNNSVCLCGCGTLLTASRQFVPGHDQRALHERVTDGWGSVARFIEWYDSDFSSSD